MTDKPEDVCHSKYNAPRIPAFVSAESTQYYIFVEQGVLCEVPSLEIAIFLFFSSFYVFHLAYPKELKNVLFFLQDYILEQPDSQ